MMPAGTAHTGAREHSTVTRSDQAELRRDARRTALPIKRLPGTTTGQGHRARQLPSSAARTRGGEHWIPPPGRLPPVPELYPGPALRGVGAVPRPLRNWLLGEESDPSVRYRVLREILEKPEDNSEVVRSRGQIGRKGGAAEILRLQQPARP